MITERLINTVTKLVENGYKGEVTITNSYPSGAAQYLEGRFSVKLEGFCKESVYIVDNTDKGYFEVYGRYNLDTTVDYEDADTKFFVDLAWSFYKCYKHSGYGLPYEWEDLFKVYGYIYEEVVTSRVIKEKD